MHTATYSANDSLRESLIGALNARGIDHDTDGHGVLEWVYIDLPDGSQIWIADVNSELDGTLAEYSGLAAVHRSGEEWQRNITVYESPSIGDVRDMAAWNRELAELLAAVESSIRTVTEVWRAADRVAATLGPGWQVDREHSANPPGRIIRHPDGRALRVFPHEHRGRRRISAVGHYPATRRPRGPQDDPMVTVAACRTASTLSWEVKRSLLPRYHRVLAAITTFNARDEREQEQRRQLAERLSVRLPGVTATPDPARPLEAARHLHGDVTGAGVWCEVAMADDASTVNVTLRDVPTEWAVGLLCTLGHFPAVSGVR
ncbi:hypothetical protein [Kitasatospora sp. NPDC086791]|uniref:hypothetical protein n=1 Tax=Kitasatospora sp. NPDC086791 TaxID=3155178 RepID=UPI003432B256